jgi:hypothetical protein
MVHDINPDLFREKYIIPNREKFAGYFDVAAEDASVALYMYWTGQHFIAKSPPGSNRGRVRKPNIQRKSDLFVGLEGSSEFNSFVSSLQSLPELGRAGRSEGDGKAVRDGLDEAFFAEIAEQRGVEVNGWTISSDGTYFIVKDGTGAVIDYPATAERFGETYMYRYMLFYARATHRFINAESARYARTTSSFDKFL